LLETDTALITPFDSSKTLPAQLKETVNGFLHAEHRRNMESNVIPADFKKLLDGYRVAHQIWCEQQRTLADGFNILQVLNVTDDEERHSMALAWLLDHRLYVQGTHGQGNLGFKLFLNELQEFGLREEYADTKDYWVKREAMGRDRRIDIEIAARGRFVIHIENKIQAQEGEGQLEGEWKDLQRRANELHVPGHAVHAIFLTPEGREAISKETRFIPVSWGKIAKVLYRFAEAAAPPDVQLFARHYAETLRQFVIQKREQREVENAEESV
jgi:hypothetical protein